MSEKELDALRKKRMLELQQRIAVRYHLVGLGREEIPKYINHRLKVTGSTQEIFEKGSYDYIFRQSGGIPRRINQLCDMALLTGYYKGINTIDSATIEAVAKDLEG